MIFSVYRPSARKGSKTRYQRLYWGQYRLDNQIKVTRVPLKTPDKQVASERLRKIVVEQQKVSEGLVAAPSLMQATTKPLDGYVEQYIRDLEGRGNASRYIYCVEHRLETLQKECGWKTASDMTSLSFETWRNGKVISVKTRNDYLQAARGFIRWMVDHNFMLSDPLVKVGKVKSNGKVARARRAFTDEELTRLLGVAEWRRPLYITAIFTGLRRGELEALTWGDVHLDEQIPYIIVRASTSKNRIEAKIWLHPDVITVLTETRPTNVAPNTKVFPPMYRMWHYKGDLKRAGIEYCDAQGRYADFHSLRHTANTLLARYGASERVRMAFMRHSDMKLTSIRYTDATQLPVAEAINRLPSFLTQHVQHVQPLVQVSGVSSPSQPSAVEAHSAEKMQDHVANKGVSRDESQGDVGGQTEEIGSAAATLPAQTTRRPHGKESPIIPGLVAGIGSLYAVRSRRSWPKSLRSQKDSGNNTKTASTVIIQS